MINAFNATVSAIAAVIFPTLWVIDPSLPKFYAALGWLMAATGQLQLLAARRQAEGAIDDVVEWLREQAGEPAGGYYYRKTAADFVEREFPS